MAVMKRFGDVIDHDETSGIMSAPARVWPQIEMTAFDADPDSGAVRVEDDVMETADDYIRRSAVNYQYRRDNGRWYQRHLIAATSNLEKELDLLKNDKNVRKIQVIPNINETSVVEGDDPNLAKAYRMGHAAEKAGNKDALKTIPQQYKSMWIQGWNDSERFAKKQGVAEGKAVAKKVKIVKGPDAGKTGWIREIKHGAFEGAAKSYYIDLDGGGQANNIPGTALRLIKDPGVAEANKHSLIGKMQRGHDLKKKVDSTYKDIGIAQRAGNHPEASKAFRKHERYANLERPGTWTKVNELDVAEAERNEMDTPAVQAALKKMAERHKGEKWTKEQLAALGKRIAARGKKAVKEGDVEDFLARGGKITQVKPNRGPRHPGLSLGSKHIGGGGDGARASRTGRGSKPQGKPVVAVEGGVDEGWKSKLAGAALAGAAALGGGAAVAHDHGDYGHYDQRLDDRNWDTAGYDDHIKSDTKLTKTTTPDGKVSRDLQDRISSVQGPNAQGEYRVFVGLNGKIISSYITKTPPQNWMVKESADNITKEDIISKLKARLGDYLSDISKEIKKDPDLVDKLSAKAPGDQMGPPVKTVTTDDGHEIQIHGNEDDGFRISIKNRPANTKFKNLDEAVMACEIFCARRRNGQADYLDEA